MAREQQEVFCMPTHLTCYDRFGSPISSEIRRFDCKRFHDPISWMHELPNVFAVEFKASAMWNTSLGYFEEPMSVSLAMR